MSSFWKLLLGGFWFLIKDSRKTRLRFQASLVASDTVFPFVFEDLGDYGTLEEIFIDEIYSTQKISAGIIFDLGSNIGASAIYFRIKYPHSQIYCFEPDPDNFRRFLVNTATMTNIHGSQTAVWSEDSEITFYSDPHRGNSSSCMKRRGRQRPVTAEARTLDTIMREYKVGKIDLLKFDVEGAETEVFANFHGARDVDTIIGEVHADLLGGADQFVQSLSKHHDVTCRQMSPDRYAVVGILRPDGGR